MEAISKIHKANKAESDFGDSDDEWGEIASMDIDDDAAWD